MIYTRGLSRPFINLAILWHPPKTQISFLQKQLSDNKETDKSNASWIENQNWEQFTDKELPAVETKILKLEADIAQEVKECKVIKSLTEWYRINMDSESQKQFENLHIISEGILIYEYTITLEN